MGEPAVDGGGPRREFFMLLMDTLNKQESILNGPVHMRILRHNTKALDDNVFNTIGKFIALAIVHGASGRSFLPYLFSTICSMLSQIYKSRER